MLEQKENLRAWDASASPRVYPLRADRPFKKKIIPCEAMDVVAKARAMESIGISFQNPLALAMGRFRIDGLSSRAPSVRPQSLIQGFSQ